MTEVVIAQRRPASFAIALLIATLVPFTARAKENERRGVFSPLVSGGQSSDRDLSIAPRSGFLTENPEVILRELRERHFNPAGITSVSDLLDARGLEPNREYLSELPFEHIDPMTGNVVLTFTDLVLPGNAGFDLKIQRSYNSKIYSDVFLGYFREDSWAGLGWTLQMGRVVDPPLYSGGVDPTLELPDGSKRFIYKVLPDGYQFVSRDYWLCDGVPVPTCHAPNGVVYTFNHTGALIDGAASWYVTEIHDTFGNSVEVNYASDSDGNAPRDAISSVEQHFGSVSRFVSFGLGGPAKSLQSMSFQGRTWGFSQSQLAEAPAQSYLTVAQPPAGPAWQFWYNSQTDPKGEMTFLETPEGGDISYQFEPISLLVCDFGTTYTRALTQRQVYGANVHTGMWHYYYGNTIQGQAPDQTSAWGPVNATTYTFHGIGNCGSYQPWRAGVLVGKSISYGAGIWEITGLHWRPSLIVSVIGWRDIWVPLLGDDDPDGTARWVLRDGKYHYTWLGYSGNYWDDGGQPTYIREQRTDSPGRTTQRSYWNQDSPHYFRGKLTYEKVTVDGSIPFEKRFQFTNDGFMTSATVHNLATWYTPYLSGNVATSSEYGTDGGSNSTTYGYNWGVVSSIDTAEYNYTTLSRWVDPDGTITWEDKGGNGSQYRTYFDYDGLFRIESITPPIGGGEETTISYETENGRHAYDVVTRGNAQTYTEIDGFSRPTRVITVTGASSPGVFQDKSYDPAGRLAFESYPSYSNPDRGIGFYYDPLNRLSSRWIDDEDASGNPVVLWNSYYYDAGNVRITDEANRDTVQEWLRFGDPSEGRLIAVTDANGKRTEYQYDSVGNLTQANHPDGKTRYWAYFGYNSSGTDFGMDLLGWELHPESGLTEYTYWPNGRLKTSHDAQDVVATYHYDRNNRLDWIDFPGVDHDLEFEFDASDNRTLLANHFVSSGFHYDGGNRLQWREDTVRATSNGPTHVFRTDYTPDGNDRLENLDYPAAFSGASRLKLTYEYDYAGRIKSIKDSDNRIYASGFTYHASGAVASLTAGNGVMESNTHTVRLRPKVTDVWKGPTDLLKLQYKYDGVGNVTSVTEFTRSGLTSQGLLQYDPVDRLTTVANFGAGTMSYDSVGNQLTRYTTSFGKTDFSINANTKRLDSYSFIPPGQVQGIVHDLEYDDNGSLLKDKIGSTTLAHYTYQPTRMMETANVGGGLTTYRYDGDDMRTVVVSGDATRYFIHGPDGRIISQFQQMCNGQVESVRDYVYGGSRLLAAVRPAVSNLPTVSFVAASSSFLETSASASADIQLTTVNGQPTPCAVSVTVAGGGGTATLGFDFSLPVSVLTFPANTASGTILPFPVTLIDDTLDEYDETAQLKLSSADASVGSNTHDLWILDNDPPPFVSIADGSGIEGTGSGVTGSVSFGITLSAPSGKTILVSYRTRDSVGSPAATAGVDYAASTGTLTFAPLALSRTATVDVYGDPIDEYDEVFSNILSSPIDVVVADGFAQGTILDDDAPPVAVATSPTVTEADVPVPLGVSVNLSLQSGKTILVGYATADGPPPAAVAGQDYAMASGTLTFTPGVTTRSVALSILGDILDEYAEGFRVGLTAVDPSNVTIDGSGGVCTILDNDPPPTMSIGDTVGLEGFAGNSPFRFDVGLSTVSGKTIAVNYSTADGTATAPSDYVATTGTFTMTPGTTSAAFDVPVVGNYLREPDEDFFANLSLPVPDDAVIVDGQGRAVIRNDDRACTPILSVPAIITQSGAYCLVLDVVYSSATGAAIQVLASDASLDLASFKIDGTGAGLGTAAVGVSVPNQQRVTVKNGTVIGFLRGVYFSNGDGVGSKNHIVERVNVEDSRETGIRMEGQQVTIRSNRVARVTGTTQNGGQSATYGIYVNGVGSQVYDNDVAGVVGMGIQPGTAIYVTNASGGVVEGNRIVNTSIVSSYGIRILGSVPVAVLDNRISNMQYGVFYADPANPGEYRDNLTTSCTIPYTNGLDQGNNH